MAGSVILAGCPHADRQAVGRARRRSAAPTSAASPSRPPSSGPGSRRDQVDYVFMGQVLQAGAGQITARQAAVNAGIPMTVPATTINKVCLSGLNSIYLADLLIQAGEADIVVAGGMESMTNAPYLLPGARAGYRLGDKKVVDSMMYDGLFCAFDQVAMGAGTEKYAASAGIDRERPGRRSPPSRTSGPPGAQKDGLFDDEIVTVEVPQRKGDPVIVHHRRGRPRRHHRRVARPAAPRVRQGRQHHRRQRQPDLRRRRRRHRRLARPRPSELGVTPLGEIVGYGQVAGPDPSLLTQPSGRHQGRPGAGRQAGQRRRPVRAQRGLRRRRPGLDGRPRHHRRHRQRQRRRHRPRPPGRHVRHPRRAHAALELARRGGGLGAAALCGGGGQGDALLVKTV